MGSTKTPIRRSAGLVRLSRDHHDGLLLCWKIRTGIKFDIPQERILNYTLHFFEKELRKHFHQEEEIIFVLLPPNDPMKIEVMAQHAIIYNMVEAMRTNGKDTRNLLTLFANELDNHIRFEERKLFPYIEERVAKEILMAAGNKIDELHQQHLSTVWTDEFWVRRN